MSEIDAAEVQRRRVLLVEDDERVRRALVRLLRWAGGWEVAGEAADEVEAVRLAASLRPDLVLLDLRLPHSNGLDLIPLLRALDPPPLVVVLTGDIEPLSRQRALDTGAAAFLVKTTPPIELLAALRSLLTS